MINISQAPLNKRLVVRSFAETDLQELSDVESRLMHLGFFDGEHISLKRRAPLFKEPLLVEVRGRLVALTLIEALLVKVEIV